MAGGIGITPFRSQIKYLLDKNERRDIILIYSAKNADEFAFKDVFNKAQEVLGLKTVYHNGQINNAMIKRQIPDWRERLFYISGPELMVRAIAKMLSEMGIGNNNIKRDYFPGYTEL